MLHAITERGFSLIEVLVASLLVTVGVVGVAGLATLATRQSTSARDTVTSFSLAQSKLEWLRAETWRFDESGARFSSPALTLSSPDALSTDVDETSDALGRDGEITRDEGAVHFRRRWHVGLVSDADPDTLELRVCVLAAPAWPRGQLPDACVWTLRTRQQ